MRVRHVKNSGEILAASPYFEADPARFCGRWKEKLGVERLYLEIGCGKGRFITEMAKKNAPEAGFIGLERISSVLCRAAERLQAEEGSSVDALPGSPEPVPDEPEKQPERRLPIVLLREEGLDLPKLFLPGEPDGIYLNFSDPWPRARHTKRRLTSDRFLPIYEELLTGGGKAGFLQMKTDNDDLFAFSLENLAVRGWTVEKQTDDLVNSPFACGNVRTEYEEQFVAEGRKIHYLLGFPPKRRA